jgi:DNA-binding XRE family transcriptional regulator
LDLFTSTKRTEIRQQRTTPKGTKEEIPHFAAFASSRDTLALVLPGLAWRRAWAWVKRGKSSAENIFKIRTIVRGQRPEVLLESTSMPQTPAEKDILKDFGLEVQKFRDDRGLTQEQFAERMGISTRQLQKIEKGLPRISFLSVLRFLGLMKPETQASFNQRFMPRAQEKIGSKPLRRPGTSL